MKTSLLNPNYSGETNYSYAYLKMQIMPLNVFLRKYTKREIRISMISSLTKGVVLGECSCYAIYLSKFAQTTLKILVFFQTKAVKDLQVLQNLSVLATDARQNVNSLYPDSPPPPPCKFSRSNLWHIYRFVRGLLLHVDSLISDLSANCSNLEMPYYCSLRIFSKEKKKRRRRRGKSSRH